MIFSPNAEELAEGGMAATAFAAFCACNLPYQNVVFVGGQLEHEIFGETSLVSSHGGIEIASSDAMQLGQIGVEHDLVAADEAARFSHRVARRSA